MPARENGGMLTKEHIIFMAALRSRCGHYIFVLWVLLSSFFFFLFLAQSQRSQIGCLSYFCTWCGLSANLGCRSETCCTWLAEKHRTQKSRQKSPSGHHCTTFSGYIFASKARIDNRKKLVKQQYVLQMSLTI